MTELYRPVPEDDEHENLLAPEATSVTELAAQDSAPGEPGTQPRRPEWIEHALDVGSRVLIAATKPIRNHGNASAQPNFVEEPLTAPGPVRPPRLSPADQKRYERELEREWRRLPERIRIPEKQRNEIPVAWLLNPMPSSVDLYSLSDKDAERLSEFLKKRDEIKARYRVLRT